MTHHSKLYQRLMNSREWRETRTSKLQRNPLCEEHYKVGKYVAASVVHHITQGARLPYHGSTSAASARAPQAMGEPPQSARCKRLTRGAVFYSAPPHPPKYTVPFLR